jgi:hypothetical protein
MVQRNFQNTDKFTYSFTIPKNNIKKYLREDENGLFRELFSKWGGSEFFFQILENMNNFFKNV